MSSAQKCWRVVGCGIALVVLPMALRAQGCEGRREIRPWLGIHTFHCQGGVCKVHGAVARSSAAALSLGNPIRSPYHYDFSVEPSLWRVHPDGPAAGKLAEGDVLVAVNGRAVTTVHASEELEKLEAGKPVRLTVRRGSRLVDVMVTPTQSCEGVWVSAGSSPHPYAEPRARAGQGAADERYAIQDVARTGLELLGVAIRCGQCVMDFSAAAEGPRFRFAEYPVVVDVIEGSLAYRAGIRPGDLLTHLDGSDIRTDEGANRLATPFQGPDVRVEIRYLRNGEPRTGVATFDPGRIR